MKKLLLLTTILSGLFLTASCRFINENFNSVEGCTEWYLNEIYDASLSLDLEKAGERTGQMIDWYSSLDYSDKARADVAAEHWLENNPLAQGFADIL